MIESLGHDPVSAPAILCADLLDLREEMWKDFN